MLRRTTCDYGYDQCSKFYFEAIGNKKKRIILSSNKRRIRNGLGSILHDIHPLQQLEVHNRSCTENEWKFNCREFDYRTRETNSIRSNSTDQSCHGINYNLSESNIE